MRGAARMAGEQLVKPRPTDCCIPQSADVPPASLEEALPACPVQLFSDGEDPCSRRLLVSCKDQVGLLFKLCELLASHGIDISRATISTEDGIVNNCFDLSSARPSHFADALDWCQELADFLNHSTREGTPAWLEGSLREVSQRLSVNPDLLTVEHFEELFPNTEDGELRYRLKLEGVNQAGLLTYATLGFVRSGFSVVRADISTVGGHFTDTFELSTKSPDAERHLRLYLPLPSTNSVPMPFHLTKSDVDIAAMIPASALSALSPKHEDGNNNCSSHNGYGTHSSSEDRGPSFFPGPDESDEQRKHKLSNASNEQSSSVTREVSPASSVTGGDRNGWGVVNSGRMASADANEGAGLRGPGGDPPARNKPMSVRFSNGDIYTGSCISIDGIQHRHGHGTYMYSKSGHETFKEYRGQWHKDKKHGYGVLFFRNGGVYVGQWVNNQKHGLGVLLDTGDGMEAHNTMPSYRYEGQWAEDRPHGLGVEESSKSPSFFGRFVNGKQYGRGVRMPLSNCGVAECEVAEGSTRTKLLDALEAELARLRPRPATLHMPSVAARKNTEELERTAMPYHFGRRSHEPVPVHTIVYNEHESGSSDRGSSTAKTVGTLTPVPVGRLPYTSMMSPGCSPSQQTPMQHMNDAGSCCGLCHQAHYGQHASAATTPDLLQLGNPGSTMVFALKEENDRLSDSPRAAGSPRATTAAAAAAAAAAAMAAAAYEEGGEGQHQEMSEDAADQSSLDHGSSWTRTITDGTPVRQQEDSCWTRTITDGTPVRQRDERLSPRLPECIRQRPNNSTNCRGNSEVLPAPAANHAASTNGNLGSRARTLKVAVTDPWLPPAAPSAASDAAGPHSGGHHLTSDGHGDSQLNSPAETRRVRRVQAVRASPLLWSEDELAAFIACLGISTEVCERVRGCRLKVVSHILDMSNTDMRRQFGLMSPVERLVLRQALKRLLDADRWENSVRNQQTSDLLKGRQREAVLGPLGKFLVSPEELKLVKMISQGGYGTVHRGVLHSKVERCGLQADKAHPVAVKEMKGERQGVRLHELLKEACVMASLHHPNICTFIGVCSEKGKHYIVSELMDCSLFDLVHQQFKLQWHGELTVSLIMNLAHDITAGIVYLHDENKLVHADLKSSNILIDYSSTRKLVPRICDFGHAAVRAHPAPHHRCGTPHWAAPEVLRGEALGSAADIYSLGVVLWEMLTQKLPHKGLSFGQVLASVGWAGWTPDLALLPEIPPEIRRLMKECLSFAPAERPASKDLQRRLRRIPKQAQMKALRMLTSFFFC